MSSQEPMKDIPKSAMIKAEINALEIKNTRLQGQINQNKERMMRLENILK